MVRVSLERSGGFTGLRTTSSLDTDELAGPEADAALQALEAAGQAREAAGPSRSASPCNTVAAAAAARSCGRSSQPSYGDPPRAPIGTAQAVPPSSPASAVPVRASTRPPAVAIEQSGRPSRAAARSSSRCGGVSPCSRAASSRRTPSGTAAAPCEEACRSPQSRR
ncbi:hypothetical protein [Kitasatospora arboriphila]|uniref:Uncharacterized protein n=1 Tax=Kitasatospora arboriphila TaxID=258052 RepID=A0ABN1TBP1_9ACTN